MKELVLAAEVGQGLVGSAAQLGEELIANDVRKEPRYRAIDSLPETHSEAVLPLKIEERVVGVLDVQSDKLNAFHRMTCWFCAPWPIVWRWRLKVRTCMATCAGRLISFV